MTAFQQKYANYQTFLDPAASSTPLAEVREFPQRQQWIGAFGGSDKSEEAVVLGLDWLARHQAADGHWGPDCLRPQPEGCCLARGHCGSGGSEHRLAQTGLAVLAMQAAGHYDFNGNEYSQRRPPRARLAGRATSGPTAVSSTASARRGECNMYEHGIAAFALADACEMADSLDREPDDRYRQAAQRGVQFIAVRPAHRRRLALHARARAAQRHVGLRLAGVGPDGGQAGTASSRSSDECVADMVEDFFKRCEMRRRRPHRATCPAKVISDATTGVGMLVHEFILEQPDSPLVKEAAKYLADRGRVAAGSTPGAAVATSPPATATSTPGTTARWPCSRPAASRGNGGTTSSATSHRPRSAAMRELRPRQLGPAGPLGHPRADAIYSTALAVLTLEVYYRYKSQRAQVYKG